MSIRQLGSDDLPAAVQLFEIRDDRSYDPGQITQILGRFENDRSLAWMAFDGASPAGMTRMLVRNLVVKKKQMRAGYWADLYIRPEYRDTLLYPRLALTMTGARRKNNLDMLYTAIRNREVARAHIGLGFVKLGELAVLAKPLRPARLTVRHKNWNFPERLTRLPDSVYRVLRLHSPRKGGLEFYEIKRDTDLAEFSSLLNSSRSSVRQVWSEDCLQERYTSNREGEPYWLVAVRNHRKLLAAGIWRAAVRGNGVRAGILMDIVFVEGQEQAARAIISSAEVQALSGGCDVMIYLDGLRESRRIIATGYWPSPERYSILCWPPDVVKTHKELADLADWRFTFADHDTF